MNICLFNEINHRRRYVLGLWERGDINTNDSVLNTNTSYLPPKQQLFNFICKSLESIRNILLIFQKICRVFSVYEIYPMET